MNVDWFFGIPYRERVLIILLSLAFGLVVSCRPLVEWYRCVEFLSFGHPSERPYPFVDFKQHPGALSPKWTPDGEHIVFASEGFQHDSTGDDLKTISELHVVGVDGSGLRTISDGSREFVLDHSPNVSPDGARVAYSEYNHVNDNRRYQDIVTIALDGTERQRLTHKVGFDSAPQWLPDSGRIAFRRDPTVSCASRDPSMGGIYTIGSSRYDFWRLTWDEDRQSRFAWSPDGKQVAVIGKGPLTKRKDVPGAMYYKNTFLDVMDADGLNRKRLIDGEALLFGPAWLPDGTRIAFFMRSHEGKYNHVTIDLNSGELSKFIDLPIDGALSWSPDGSQIMLSNGKGIVYLVQADGSGDRLFSDVEVKGLGSFNATWSPDGSRIAVGMPGGSGVVLATVNPDGSDVRVLARRGENGELEAIGASQRGDGTIDAITCARTKYPVNCLQVVNDRLVLRDECSSAFSWVSAGPKAGLVQDCEALWALGRWATEARQPGQFEQTGWDERTPVSEWEGVEVGMTSTGLRVVELSLEDWNLSGPISSRLAAELSKLKALESVDLSGNRLSGCIPHWLRGKVVGYEEPEGCEGRG